MTGQLVRTLVDREDGPGTYQVRFALGAVPGGRPLAAGVYLVRIIAGADQRSVRVVGLN